MEQAKSFVPELPEPHPLKSKIQSHKIPYWQLARMFPRSECWWSRAMNGIVPIPPDIAEKVTMMLAALEGGTS
jgi:hypothetical protein